MENRTGILRKGDATTEFLYHWGDFNNLEVQVLTVCKLNESKI